MWILFFKVMLYDASKYDLLSYPEKKKKEPVYVFEAGHLLIL